MEKAKIQLSSEELALMQNSAWILTKNGVMEKIALGLGQVSARMQEAVLHRSDLLPPASLQLNPKIARGEKYLGLPYLMLDYPRVFEKDNVLAIRTFFWWGNFCSVTLHVKGIYKARVLSRCLERFAELQEGGIYAAVSTNEWNHDLLSPAYETLTALSPFEMERMQAKVFVKFARLVRLGSWAEMESEVFDAFSLWLGMMES